MEKGVWKVSQERISAVLQMIPPRTQKEVRQFLGMVGNCRQWIPNFSLVAKSLQKPTHHDVSEPLLWDDGCTQAFSELKESLCHPLVLGMPDYTKGLLFYCERDGCALSLFVQTHGTANRPVAYFSAGLDPVAAALPGCL